MPRPTKGPPTESDLSQVIAHGPALSQAYGPRIGALLLLFAIAKARRGTFGITAAIGIVGTALYHVLIR